MFALIPAIHYYWLSPGFHSFVETNPSSGFKVQLTVGPELVVVIPEVGCPPNVGPDGESFTTSGFESVPAQLVLV